MNVAVILFLPLLAGGAILVGLLILTRIMPGVPGKAPAVEATAVTVPARGPQYVKFQATRIASYRKGLLVFLGLVMLTIIELAVAIATGSLVPLFILALAKAGLILNYFMHIRTVWSEEAH